MNPTVKTIKKRIELLDVLWAPVAGFLLFKFSGSLISWLYSGVYSYDPTVFQAAIQSVAITMMFFGFARAGIYFMARGLWQWFYGYTDRVTGQKVRPAQETFASLLPWQKFIIFFSFLFVLVLLPAAILLSLASVEVPMP